MIQVKNVTKIYNPKKANEFEALHGVSCEIADGELVAIIGKSGAGKSTLLHILACIDNYQDGEYTIDDTVVKNLSERQYAKIRNEKIGMVMQDFAIAITAILCFTATAYTDHATNKTYSVFEALFSIDKDLIESDYTFSSIRIFSGAHNLCVVLP